MDRRGFLISTGAALASVAAHWNDALADLPLSQDSGRRLTASMVTRLEQRLDDLRHLDDVLSSAELRPSAVAEYNLLSRLAQRATYDGAVGRRLFSNLAEASRMCGWLYFDAGLNATVQRFYITSLRASASAGDHEAGANTLNFMTSQTYTVGNPQDAVNLIRTAQEKISGRTTARVRARLHARAARALSKTGELKSCAHELDAARDAYATGPHDDDPPWAYSLTAGEIEMTAGSCALDLKDPGRALAHFTAAQASEFATTGNVRDSLLYLTRAAQAHLALGDLDATCATATEVFNENNAVGSSRPSDALSSLRDQLITHRDVGVVRDFLNLSA
ncbi:hypothetical protein [Streptomyces corynorhini]|nr:hypothetical protein [Streptomyces corynorhini]